MKKGKRWYCDVDGCGREIPESQVDAKARVHYCVQHAKGIEEQEAALQTAMEQVSAAVTEPPRPEVRITPIDGKMQATIIPEGEASKQYNLCAQCADVGSVCDVAVILLRLSKMTGVQIIVTSCPKHPMVDKYLFPDK
jgi:hypothetical protein